MAAVSPLEEFPLIPLEEVAELKGGYAFKSTDYTDKGAFVLRTLNIGADGSIGRENAVFIDENRVPEFERFNLVEWDTVFVMVGATLGKTGLVRPGDLPALLNQNMWVIRAKRSLMNPRFLHYMFASQSKTLIGWASGAARDFVRRDDFRKLMMPSPPLAEQRAIADVLGALDDKIESNRRLSRTATELCDQMFLTASEIDVQISKAAQVTMGSSPSGDTYNTDGVGMPFYQGVTDFGFLSPTRRMWTTAPIRVAKTGETLVSVRAPVGRLNEASEQCCIGRGVATISSHYQTTLFYALRQADAVWAPFEGEGTVFGSINKGDLEGARIPWIKPERISGLDSELAEVHQYVRASMRELQHLASLRDALLPELLSGRLRVKDAESMMENV